jgi:isopentenyldiphosphate isomerase
MKEEMIYVVDEKDNVVSETGRKEAIEKNLLRRGIIVLVFNSKGEMLIAQRTKIKDSFPCYYNFGAGGTVSSGESYKQCALRELEEELGIKDTSITFLFNNRYKSEETNLVQKVYSCIYDGELKLQTEEVERTFFMPLERVKEFMKKEKFCPDLYPVFNKYIEMRK